MSGKDTSPATSAPCQEPTADLPGDGACPRAIAAPPGAEPEPWEGPGAVAFLGLLASQFRRATGTLPEQRAEMGAALDRAFTGILPRDETEAMLAAQMIGLHNAAMDCLQRAALPEQPHYARHANLANAVKLQRAYTLSMEALDKHRGKGQQKVTVEHVHVHQGGQAIVGNVTREGGSGNR